jgi:hypothetical protein
LDGQPEPAATPGLSPILSEEKEIAYVDDF